MFKRILAPLDFTEDMDEFAKCLAGFKTLGAEEVIFAYCMDMPDISNLRKHVHEILIVEAAERPEISCVLMGSQGRGFFGEITVGSVSHNVACHARKPVLLIPPEEAGGDPLITTSSIFPPSD